jgi:hypothetical protein
MKRLLPALALLVLCSCESTFPVTFHMENRSDISSAMGMTDKFSLRVGNKVFDRAAFISQKDFDNYRSFLSNDGTYGVVFTANKKMWTRIQAYTTSNLGSDILPMVNGHPMELLHLYNRPISTGQLVVWGGFTPADLAALSKVVDPTPEEKAKGLIEQGKYSKKNLSISPQESLERQKEREERKVISEKRGRF